MKHPNGTALASWAATTKHIGTRKDPTKYKNTCIERRPGLHFQQNGDRGLKDGWDFVSVFFLFLSLSLSHSPSLSSFSLETEKNIALKITFPLPLVQKTSARPPKKKTRIMWKFVWTIFQQFNPFYFRNRAVPTKCPGSDSRPCPYTRANQYQGQHLQSPTTAELANFTAGSLSVLSRDSLVFVVPTYLHTKQHTYMHK